MDNVIFCPKHPKYKGNKKPTNNCTICARYYIMLKKKGRILPRPTRQHRDKSKYTRKIKHRKGYD